MSAYSFPTMSSTALVESIGQVWEVDLDVQRISQPSPQLVWTLYTRAIEYLTGVTPEALESAQARVMASSNNDVDFCADTVSMNLLFYHLQRVCKIAKFDGLRMSDIYDPHPDRTIKILSALMNVCQFMIERNELFARLRKESDEAVEENEQLSKQLAALRSKVNAIKAEREKEEPRIRELERAAGALKEQLEIVAKDQALACHESLVIKEERNVQRDKLESLANERQVAFDTNAEIKSRIVEEPERMKSMISEMKRQVEQYRLHIADNEAKARELRAKADRSVTYEQDIRAATQVLAKVEEQQLALQSATRKYNEQKAELDQRETEKSELMEKHARTQKKLENAQARLRDATETALRKRESSEKAIARLRAEYEQMKSERKDNDADVEETKKQIEEIERQMHTHLRENEAQLNEMLQEYWRLRHQVAVYMEMLGTQMGFQLDV